MNKEVMLKGVIEVYQNDFESGYDNLDKPEKKLVLLELILQLSRYVNNIRYCRKEKCGCSPESGIAIILKSNLNWLDNEFFKPYSLTDVNMRLVFNELKKIGGVDE